ncbi:MAG: redox-sensing transcriptional repressor Rex [Chlorobiaceae bacterium]|nr:redox-sensing transcriptional repressor Rex [Chlorobiaceae bacterium]MBA4310416.1 redox-sensing transcriptional repressor Rex [Chlorobiaceae bacterium]
MIPEPTLRRFPQYIHLLKRLRKESTQYISSTTIADELELDSIQVRKDLAITGVVGKPKLGFDIDELISALSNILNWDNSTDAFLVGAGSLGSALLGYKNFNQYGLNIVAAFDNDPNKIGKTISGIEVLPLEKFGNMVERMKVHIGIITAPPEAAQKIAEVMVQSGIQAIWNFSSIHLKVPFNIIVEDALLTQSLGVLTHTLSEKLKKEIAVLEKQ